MIIAEKDNFEPQNNSLLTQLFLTTYHDGTTEKAKKSGGDEEKRKTRVSRVTTTACLVDGRTVNAMLCAPLGLGTMYYASSIVKDTKRPIDWPNTGYDRYERNVLISCVRTLMKRDGAIVNA